MAIRHLVSHSCPRRLFPGIARLISSSVALDLGIDDLAHVLAPGRLETAWAALAARDLIPPTPEWTESGVGYRYAEPGPLQARVRDVPVLLWLHLIAGTADGEAMVDSVLLRSPDPGDGTWTEAVRAAMAAAGSVGLAVSMTHDASGPLLRIARQHRLRSR